MVQFEATYYIPAWRRDVSLPPHEQFDLLITENLTREPCFLIDYFGDEVHGPTAAPDVSAHCSNRKDSCVHFQFDNLSIIVFTLS